MRAIGQLDERVLLLLSHCADPSLRGEEVSYHQCCTVPDDHSLCPLGSTLMTRSWPGVALLRMSLTRHGMRPALHNKIVFSIILKK